MYVCQKNLPINCMHCSTCISSTYHAATSMEFYDQFCLILSDIACYPFVCESILLNCHEHTSTCKVYCIVCPPFTPFTPSFSSSSTTHIALNTNTYARHTPYSVHRSIFSHLVSIPHRSTCRTYAFNFILVQEQAAITASGNRFGISITWAKNLITDLRIRFVW